MTCLCPMGFSGDFCELEVNECESNPCVQADECVDLVADYRCECLPGYTGKVTETQRINNVSTLNRRCSNTVCQLGISQWLALLRLSSYPFMGAW